MAPRTASGSCGEMVIESSASALTVRLAEPLTEPDVAVIVVVPVPTVLARPSVPVELLTVAAAAFDELQCADWVRSWTLPSLYVPLAVNCWVVPSGIEGAAGVTAIERSVRGTTFRAVEPLMFPKLALMVAVPSPVLVAKPDVDMMATDVFDEPQATEAVRSCVPPLPNVPVAVNCLSVPSAIDELAGVRAIETSVAALTVKVVDPLTEPEVAVIVVDPCPTLVARP